MQVHCEKDGKAFGKSSDKGQVAHGGARRPQSHPANELQVQPARPMSDETGCALALPRRRKPHRVRSVSAPAGGRASAHRLNRR